NSSGWPREFSHHYRHQRNDGRGASSAGAFRRVVREACEGEFDGRVSGGRRFHGRFSSWRSSTGITDGAFKFGSWPDQPCAQDGKRVFSGPVGRTRRGGMEQRERDRNGG